MSQRRIVWVTYGGGHVAMVIPTVRELRRRGGWDITVLGLTTAAPKLAAAGIPWVGFQDLLDPHDERALEHGRRLATENHAPNSGISWDESVAYLGLCYTDLEDRFGVTRAAELYATNKRHAFLPLGPLRRLLQRANPDVVVATSSPKSERASIMVAAELGIPSVALLDGFTSTWDFFFDPNYADRVLVPSEMDRDELLERGRRADQLIITGNPAFDRLSDPRWKEIGRQWRSAHRLKDSQVIFWPTSTALTEVQRNEVFRCITQILDRRPSWYFVYRPHPSMPKTCPPLHHRAFFDDGTQLDVAALLHAADTVLVDTSTVGMEAALLDLPLVKLCMAAHDSSPYDKMGLAIPVGTLAEIEPALAVSMSENETTASLRQARRKLPPVGHGAKRVVDALEELLGTFVHGRHSAQRTERLAG